MNSARPKNRRPSTTARVAAGFFPARGEGRKELKGLALPMHVLENFYYKNAVRLYPRVKEVLEGMGYALE